MSFDRASRRAFEVKHRLWTEFSAMSRLRQVAGLCAALDSDFQDRLIHVVKAAVSLTGAQKGTLHLLDDEKEGSLSLIIQFGFSQRGARYFGERRGQTSACGEALRTHRRTVVQDITDHRFFTDREAMEMMIEEGIWAFQCTPLMSSKDRLLGTLSTYCSAPRCFSHAELRRVDVLVRQAVDFIERRQREQAMIALNREREDTLQAEQAARKEAERAMRLKDDFLATLSHELRTPIQAILGWAQILQKRQSPEDLKTGLEAIERNARAQAQLVADLLDMSRIVSGKLRLEVRQVDLPAIIEQAIETVQPAASAKGIRIRKLFTPLAGVVTRGDEDRLRQVVWNLLTNAVKFTPCGGNISVRVERVERNVELSVTDSGTGIAPEFLPYVFERFRQADSSATRKQAGLGLGLAIVRSLVEAHGGTARASSGGVDQGATFVVTLPLRTKEEEEEERIMKEEIASPLAQEPSQASGDVDLTGVKVLIVDDEADTRALLKHALEDTGAQVATASSADETLIEMSREVPDVLISDLAMPGKSGFDLIRAVRALDEDHGAGVPAVALTAYARAEDRTRALDSGFQMHISKPVEFAELRAAVASLTGRSSAPPLRA